LAGKRRTRNWAILVGCLALVVVAAVLWRDRAHECRASRAVPILEEQDEFLWTECGDGVARSLICAATGRRRASDSQPTRGKERAAPDSAVDCQCMVDGALTKKFKLDDASDALKSLPAVTETANDHCGWSLGLRYSARSRRNP
jgi:hypothetical protein